MADDLNAETLRALHEAATQGEWQAFEYWCSELGGSDEYDSTMLIGIGPYDTLAEVRPGSYDCGTEFEENAHLIAYLRNAVPEILSLLSENDRLKARVGELEDRLQFWAKRRTIDEILQQPDRDAEWDNASVEKRIEMMRERKRKHDEEVLAARAVLEGSDND